MSWNTTATIVIGRVASIDKESAMSTSHTIVVNDITSAQAVSGFLEIRVFFLSPPFSSQNFTYSTNTYTMTGGLPQAHKDISTNPGSMGVTR